MLKPLRRFAALPLVLLILPAILDAQLPRARPGYEQTWKRSNNPRHLRDYLTTASFWHMVTVDSGGAGDFIKLGDGLAPYDSQAALDHIAQQTRGAGARWVVYIYPGATDASGYGYSETSITVPSFTLLQCATAPGEMALLNASQCMVRITGTSGAGVTVGTGSNIADLGFNFTGALEAGFKGVSCPAGCTATLARSMFFVAGTAPDVAFDLISITGGSLTAEAVSLQRGGSGKVNARLVHASSGSAVFYGSYFLASSSQAVGLETTGGTIRLIGGRIAGGAVVDLRNTSGTLTADHVTYVPTKDAAVTRVTPQGTPKHTSGNSTLPTVCEVPELYTDTTGAAERLCSCTSANTWRCVALAAP